MAWQKPGIKVTAPKDNSGALFKNKKKSRDQDPDYNGSIMVDGRDYWLNAWLNTSKAGEKYMSVKLRPKAEAPAYQNTTYNRQRQEERQDVPPIDEEIPF